MRQWTCPNCLAVNESKTCVECGQLSPRRPSQWQWEAARHRAWFNVEQYFDAESFESRHEFARKAAKAFYRLAEMYEHQRQFKFVSNPFHTVWGGHASWRIAYIQRAKADVERHLHSFALGRPLASPIVRTEAETISCIKRNIPAIFQKLDYEQRRRITRRIVATLHLIRGNDNQHLPSVQIARIEKLLFELIETDRVWPPRERWRNGEGFKREKATAYFLRVIQPIPYQFRATTIEIREWDPKLYSALASACSYQRQPKSAKGWRYTKLDDLFPLGAPRPRQRRALRTSSNE